MKPGKYVWLFVALALQVLPCFSKDVLAEQRVSKQKLRKWRIVVNDDGEVPIPGKNRSLEQFLVPKFNDVVGTQVDAYFLCMASTDRHVVPQAARLQDTMNQWAQDGKIPEQLDIQIRTYIDAIRKAGMDLFLSVRMNDIHDAWAKKLSYPLKIKRPELLIGTRQNFGTDTLMSAHWSGLNYAHAEVRRHFLDFILWCCRQYDFDGVELDWFRHPLFFRLGEEQKNIESMNGFMRQLRAGLNRIAGKRGKPIFLTVRTLDTPEQCLHTGLDVEQWLKEGLLDLLVIGGGYLPYGARLKQFIDMAHRYQVPAYPVINHFKEPEMMRSVASNFFALGADGFYLFNWYGVPDGSEKAKCLEQCGAPTTLAGLDKRYVADNGCRIRYCGYSNPPSQFPTPLVGGHSIEIVVGDDVANARRKGAPARITLLFAISKLCASPDLIDLVRKAPPRTDLAVQVNGVQLPEGSIRFEPRVKLKTSLWSNSEKERDTGLTFAATVDASLLRRGINHVRVFPGRNSPGPLEAAIEAVELVVDYLPYKESDDREKTGEGRPVPDPIVIKPASGIPLSLYGVPVGSKKNIVFVLKTAPAAIRKARLALKADDFDSPEEVTISVNGHKPLAIPETLLADMGFRSGLIEVPVNQLQQGRNTITFTFASDLRGRTKGYDVAEALLALDLK